MEYGEGGGLELIVEVFVEPDAGLVFILGYGPSAQTLADWSRPLLAAPPPREIDSGICS